jgi:heme/copper-type cytochrome/quinol oxidase subunit 2
MVGEPRSTACRRTRHARLVAAGERLDVRPGHRLAVPPDLLHHGDHLHPRDVTPARVPRDLPGPAGAGPCTRTAARRSRSRGRWCRPHPGRAHVPERARVVADQDEHARDRLPRRVIAKQFNWEFIYPGPDGEFGTDDDKRFIDETCTCPSTPWCTSTSAPQDVIHSFFVPQFRMKQDAVPGREIRQWFEATKPGRYELPCAELCGFGHSGMRGWIYVHTREDYEKWAAREPDGGGGAGRRRTRRQAARDARRRPGHDGRERQAMSASPTHARRARRARAPRPGLRPPLHLLHRSQDDRPSVPPARPRHDDPGRDPRPHGALAAGLAGDAGAGMSLFLPETGGILEPSSSTTWPSRCTPPS